MQPDPDVYLWRAQQELRDIVTAGAVADPAAALAIGRIAELLSQLALRETTLPRLLDGLSERQDDLLVRTSGLLGAPAAPLAGGGVAGFDQRARAQAEAIHTLAHRSEGNADFLAARAGLMAEARALEAAVRQAVQASLTSEARAQQALRRDDDARTPPPTPAELEAFINARVPGARACVTSIRQQRGVNTKDILFLEVDGVPGWPRLVVMRRLRGFNVNHLVSMAYEFGLLNTLNAVGIITPRALLMDDGQTLGQPLIMLEQLAGESKRAAQLGTDGPGLALQLARHLGAIHRLDPAITGRPDLALAPRERVLAHIDSYYQLWRANHIEPSSLVESGFAWVRDNVARLSSETVLVHGDYDLRNVLIDGDQISAVLDWERSHIGHPAEDLAYCRPDAEQFAPWSEFLAAYLTAGGRPVSEAEIEFFQIWTQVFRMTSISRAHAGYVRGEHADFLLGSSGYVEYVSTAAALHTALQGVS